MRGASADVWYVQTTSVGWVQALTMGYCRTQTRKKVVDVLITIIFNSN